MNQRELRIVDCRHTAYDPRVVRALRLDADPETETEPEIGDPIELGTPPDPFEVTSLGVFSVFGIAIAWGWCAAALGERWGIAIAVAVPAGVVANTIYAMLKRWRAWEVDDYDYTGGYEPEPEPAPDVEISPETAALINSDINHL